MTQQRAWQGKTGGGRTGQFLLLKILRRIPVTTLYPVLWFVVPFYLLFARKGRSAMWHYFRQIRHYGRFAAVISVIRNHFVFGRVVLDKFALAAGRHDFVIETKEQDDIESLIEDEKGFIIAGSHIGNFELLGHYLPQNKKKVNCLIYGGENQDFQQKRDAEFARSNVQLVPIREDMTHLFAIKKALEQGEIVVCFCDRVFSDEKTVSVDFLGRNADFPTGIFRLANLFDTPVVTGFLMKEKKNHYSCYMHILNTEDAKENTPQKLVQRYAHSLEKVLEIHPEQWFNYFDFWKLKK